MKRMDELQLKQHSSQSAKNYVNEGQEKARKFDVVTLHLIVNAHAAGFYTGARHVERYGQHFDGRRWADRYLFFWRPKPTRDTYAQEASQAYVTREYGSMKDQNNLMLIKAAFAQAFALGFDWRPGVPEQEVQDDQNYLANVRKYAAQPRPQAP